VRVSPLTPLDPAPAALGRGRAIYLKREDAHELGAFKWRGALPTLEAFAGAGVDGVVTASTGNHGAATAWAAGRLGLRAVVFAPPRASRRKLALVEAHGADVRLAGRDFDEAKEAAREFAEAQSLRFFEDGRERTQYDGYRAIAAEVLDQLDEPPGALVVPVGNGALLGGIGLELCDRSPDTARVGVVPRAAPVMAQSWETGEPLVGESADTIADGLAVRVPIPLAVAVLGEVASRMVLVSERAMAEAMVAFADAGITVEPSAAATLAALPDVADVEGPVVLVVTGRNVDEALLTRARERPDSFPD
jgi:threonine dehydratase